MQFGIFPTMSWTSVVPCVEKEDVFGSKPPSGVGAYASRYWSPKLWKLELWAPCFGPPAIPLVILASYANITIFYVVHDGK